MSGAKTAVRKLTNELINSAIYIYDARVSCKQQTHMCVCVCDMYVCMYNKNLIRYHVIVKADYDRDNCL